MSSFPPRHKCTHFTRRAGAHIPQTQHTWSQSRFVIKDISQEMDIFWIKPVTRQSRDNLPAIHRHCPCVINQKHQTYGYSIISCKQSGEVTKTPKGRGVVLCALQIQKQPEVQLNKAEQQLAFPSRDLNEYLMMV